MILKEHYKKHGHQRPAISDRVRQQMGISDRMQSLSNVAEKLVAKVQVSNAFQRRLTATARCKSESAPVDHLSTCQRPDQQPRFVANLVTSLATECSRYLCYRSQLPTGVAVSVTYIRYRLRSLIVVTTFCVLFLQLIIVVSATTCCDQVMQLVILLPATDCSD